MPAGEGARPASGREGRDYDGVRMVREAMMGYIIMIAGIVVFLGVAVYAVRELAKEDTEDDDDGGN